MAVAVKTSQGARSSGTTGGLVLYSFVGVIYLAATIAIVFDLLPRLWWSAWEGMGAAQATIVGGSLLAILELAAAVGLLWGGARLLGRNPVPGVRAGVFVGFLGLLGVLLLTRWAGRLFEGYVFDSRSFSPQTGAILTGVVGGLSLAVWAYVFTRAWMRRVVVGLEEGGWFHATVYKGNQGRVVRRGTIIGILLLIGAGVYSLMHSGMLRRGPSDWALSIPFTGKVAVERMGDVRGYVHDLPATAKKEVQIKWVGDEKSKVRVDDVVTVERYKAYVKDALDQADKRLSDNVAQTQDEIDRVKDLDRGNQDAERLAALERDLALYKQEQADLADARKKLESAAEEDPTDYLLAVNKAIHAEFERVAPSPEKEKEKKADTEQPPHAGLLDDVRRRLHETSRQTPWDDLSKLLAAIKKDAETAKKTKEVGWVLSLPTAIPVIDRAALQEANDKRTEKVIVGIVHNTDFRLPEGKMVDAEDFDAEERRIYLGVATTGANGLEEGDSVEGALLEQLKDTKNGTAFRDKLDELIKDTGNELAKRKLRASSARSTRRKTWASGTCRAWCPAASRWRGRPGRCSTRRSRCCPRCSSPCRCCCLRWGSGSPGVR